MMMVAWFADWLQGSNSNRKPEIVPTAIKSNQIKIK